MWNKRLLFILLYWIVALIAVAMVLSSLAYTFVEALFLGSMFLPGSFCVRYFWPKSFGPQQSQHVRNTIFLILGVLVGELLLIVLAHEILHYFRHQANLYPTVPEILVNPLFILIMLAVIVAGDMMLNRYLRQRFQFTNRNITFVSNRRSVTLPVVDIRYVESNDTEVWIYATDDRKFRNKTPISQWENLLGDDFVRIHRSYLVRRSYITSVSADSLTVGETRLPISRKYSAFIRSQERKL